jgi:protein-disulfide isomerase
MPRLALALHRARLDADPGAIAVQTHVPQRRPMNKTPLSTSTSGPRGLGKLIAFGALGLIGFVLPACAGEKAAEGKGEIVAEVGGKPITLADLEASVAPQLAQIERQRQQLLEQALNRLVEEKLIEAEAAARGVAKEALIQTEITAKVGEVTDAEVAQWYEANKNRVGNRPLEQLAPQIKTFLGQQKGAGVREQLIADLRTKHKARMLMDVARTEVAEGGAPAKGPAKAPVTIIEFSDFECPFCNRVVPSVDEAVRTYGDQLRVVFRQFPLNIHPNAQKAAEASLCADEQGKFWQMHDLMFSDQKKLGVTDLKAKAGSLGVDQARFDQCLDGGKFTAKVAADMAEGQKAGVTGTPALFINGRAISGAVPFGDLARVIDDELARKGIEPKKATAQ